MQKIERGEGEGRRKTRILCNNSDRHGNEGSGKKTFAQYKCDRL